MLQISLKMSWTDQQPRSYPHHMTTIPPLGPFHNYVNVLSTTSGGLILTEILPLNSLLNFHYSPISVNAELRSTYPPPTRELLVPIKLTQCYAWYPVFPTGRVGQALMKPGPACWNSRGSSLARAWPGRAAYRPYRLFPGCLYGLGRPAQNEPPLRVNRKVHGKYFPSTQYV